MDARRARPMLATWCVLGAVVGAPAVLAQADPAPGAERGLAASASGVPIAPGSDPDAAAALARVIEKHRVPAMAVAVIHGGKVVRLAAAGVRAAGHTTGVTLEDRWHLGSCTKAMTATLCAALVEKGTLRWETTLAEAFPDLADAMHAEFRGATLAQLCSNRAGVPGDISTSGLWDRLWKAQGTPTAQRRLLLEGVTSRRPAHAPGSAFEYSNAGFAIAGHVCETAGGKPYEALMQEMVFGPLGMTTCGWGAPGTPAVGALAGVFDQPRGHNAQGRPEEPEPSSPSGVGADNPIAISPAGRLHCSVEDWARFVTVHLRGHARNPDREARLLGAASFERLHAPPDGHNPYAYGWVTGRRGWAGPKPREGAPAPERVVLTHAGSNTLWFAVAWLAPARDFAVIVCCNRAGPGEKACDEVASAMIAMHPAP